MVKLCLQKGLNAYVMDFLGLDFPASSFDAIYSLNCLLHVPTHDLPQVLQKLQGLLKPTGLFYLGVYGEKSMKAHGPKICMNLNVSSPSTPMSICSTSLVNSLSWFPSNVFSQQKKPVFIFKR